MAPRVVLTNEPKKKVARRVVLEEPDEIPEHKPVKKLPKIVALNHRAYAGKPTEAGAVKGLKLSYRVRANTSIEQRDYFVGKIRIGYARMTAVKELYLDNIVERLALEPVSFQTEKAMHAFIMAELQ